MSDTGGGAACTFPPARLHRAQAAASERHAAPHLGRSRPIWADLRPRIATATVAYLTFTAARREERRASDKGRGAAGGGGGAADAVSVYVDGEAEGEGEGKGDLDASLPPPKEQRKEQRKEQCRCTSAAPPPLHLRRCTSAAAPRCPTLLSPAPRLPPSPRAASPPLLLRLTAPAPAPHRPCSSRGRRGRLPAVQPQSFASFYAVRGLFRSPTTRPRHVHDTPYDTSTTHAL